MTKREISKRIKDSIRPGYKNGYLTITSEPYRKGTYIYYETVCICGKKGEINRGAVGVTVSCGCILGEATKPLTSIPNEHSDKRSKLMREGKVLVLENGVVFRVKGNVYFEARKFKISGREGVNSYIHGYYVITYDENGKQKHEYIHRLVAEAFVKNPDKKDQVNHKDGVKTNNNYNNLEWVTSQENIIHAYENDLIAMLSNTKYKCIRCSEPVMRNRKVCTDCKNDMIRTRNALKIRQLQRNEYRNIDTSNLSLRDKKIVKSRFRGDTQIEIANQLGYAFQYISRLDIRIKKRHLELNKEEK